MNREDCKFRNFKLHIIVFTITSSALRQVHSLFQSEFSTGGIYYFLLVCQIYSPFLKVILQLLTSSYSSSSRPFYLSFNYVFQKAVPTQVVTYTVSLPLLYCMQDFLSLFDHLQYFFLNRSAQLQHLISKHTRHL